MSTLVRLKFTLAAFTVLVVGLAATTDAATVYLTDGPGSPGGVFNAKVAQGSVGQYGLNETFQTFCVEYNEFITLPGTYNATVTTGAVNGGTSGGNPDYLDPRTAYLYASFMSGTLVGYDHSTDAANALQRAIWTLEGETGWTAVNANVTSLTSAFLGAANLAGWTDAQNVRVLHLETLAGGTAQDQLVLVPTPVASLGGGVMMLSMAAGGLWRRRQRQTV